MITCNLEERDGLPLYEFLYRRIREDILAGRIRPGERLPSKRALARHLQVAVVTVEHAYAQLVAEGYLLAREKRGYFAAAIETREETRLPVVAKQDNPAAPPPAPRRADSAFAPPPFSVWARLTRAVLTEAGPALLQPIPHNGILELRQALAGLLYRLRGITASPEQIVVGAGTEYLYTLIVQLLGREPVYALEDPGYRTAGQVYALNGARCVPVPIDLQGLDPGALSGTEARILHLSPNHQFPTGAVMPISRRQALLAWAEREEGRFLIEDDYDSEFRFTGRPIPPLQSIDREGRVLYLNTFSRTFSPALRISYLVLPPSLLERYHAKLGFYSCTVPALEQLTLARFLNEGHFEKHLNRARLRYRAQRNRILALLQESPLSSVSRVFGENAGLHFLLTLETKRPDSELAAAAREQGLRLAFLSDYCAAPLPRWDHTLILPYPALDPERFPAGLETLAKLL